MGSQEEAAARVVAAGRKVEPDALLHAAMQGRGPLCIDLVDAGVSVDAKDTQQRSALHLACLAGKGAAVTTLLSKGADVGSRSIIKQTPLMAALGYPAVLQLLIDAKADLDAVDESGRTALMLAAMHGKEQAAELLLSHGANAKIKDANNKTAEELKGKTPCGIRG